ncbi:MAG: DNA-directed RNA polymerase subunit omega [Candidatus Hydrogenedentes bacterium]|nr:DNA-directed RNA polymerase subunit omega [Candidatus Hydrogenedentota bacterium]
MSNKYPVSVEDFKDKIDSLYRLVIVASQRARQLARPDSRALVPTRSRRPTMTALDEILQGKVKYKTGLQDEDEYIE